MGCARDGNMFSIVRAMNISSARKKQMSDERIQNCQFLHKKKT